MKAKEVLLKYHRIVPFPITRKKIQKAGYDPTEYLLKLAEEIRECEDSDTPTAQEFLKAVEQLKKGGSK